MRRVLQVALADETRQQLDAQLEVLGGTCLGDVQPFVDLELRAAGAQLLAERGEVAGVARHHHRRLVVRRRRAEAEADQQLRSFFDEHVADAPLVGAHRLPVALAQHVEEFDEAPLAAVLADQVDEHRDVLVGHL